MLCRIAQPMLDYKKFWSEVLFFKYRIFMMNKQLRMNGAICSFLLLLSGCGCEKKGDTAQKPVDEEVLVSMSGNPLLTLSEFQSFIKEAIGADPQMQFMAQMMPDFEEQLFERAKLSEIVLDEWAKKAQVALDEEYKKMRAQAEKALSTMLNQKMFIKKHVGDVSDSEAQKHYNDNKGTDPSLVLSPEGVEAKGVSFEKEADANNFLAKVKEFKGDIEKAAKAIKKDVDDLGLVSQMSMIDQKVKDKLLELKKAPSLLPLIKGDKDFWVVKAFKREKAKHVPFEQAKDKIKESLANKKIEEVFEKKIPEYQKEYGIEVNRAYFDKKRKEREEQQAKMMQQMKESDKQEAVPVPDKQAKELANEPGLAKQVAA